MLGGVWRTSALQVAGGPGALASSVPGAPRPPRSGACCSGRSCAFPEQSCVIESAPRETKIAESR